MYVKSESGRGPVWLRELRILCKLCKLWIERRSSRSSRVDLNALITRSCKNREGRSIRKRGGKPANTQARRIIRVSFFFFIFFLAQTCVLVCPPVFSFFLFFSFFFYRVSPMSAYSGLCRCSRSCCLTTRHRCILFFFTCFFFSIILESRML